MDAENYFATVHLLTQNPPLEERLQLLLETTNRYLNLDLSLIFFVTEEGRSFHILTKGDGGKPISECSDEFLCIDSYRHFTDGEIVVSRQNIATTDFLDRQYAVDTHRSRKKIVVGADFKPHKSLEVRLRFIRQCQQGDFTDAEIALVEKLVMAVKNAIAGEMHEQNQALFAMSTGKLLARSRIGIIVVNRQLEILEKSALADELLQKTRAYRCSESNTLIGTSVEHQMKLDETLEELIHGDERIHKALDVLPDRSSEQYTMVFAKNPSPRKTLFYETTFSVFIVAWQEEQIDLSTLFELWKITPAEKKVLSAISHYDNIKKVAIELNISTNTAKAQLKSVYKKLGVDSKTMLLKRLSLLRKIDALLS